MYVWNIGICYPLTFKTCHVSQENIDCMWCVMFKKFLISPCCTVLMACSVVSNAIGQLLTIEWTSTHPSLIIKLDGFRKCRNQIGRFKYISISFTAYVITAVIAISGVQIAVMFCNRLTLLLIACLYLILFIIKALMIIVFTHLHVGCIDTYTPCHTPTLKLSDHTNENNYYGMNVFSSGLILVRVFWYLISKFVSSANLL